MLLNQYHSIFMTGGPLIQFIKSKGFSYTGNSLRAEVLIEKINQIEDKIDKKELNEYIFKCLYQGRRKIIFTDLCRGEAEKYIEFKHTNEFNISNIDITQSMNGILNLNSIGEEEELIDLVFKVKNQQGKYEYIFKSNNSEEVICGNIEEIIFIFKKNVFYIKDFDEADIPDYKKIPIPVFVTIDILNEELNVRVPAKSDLYDVTTNEKLEDIDIGKSFINKVKTDLELGIEEREVYKRKIATCIFDIHKKITELPKEITDKSDIIKDDIKLLIETTIKKLDLGLSALELEEQNIKEQIFQGINNVYLKEIIKTYSEEDIALFEENKFAKSIGIKSKGLSYSNFGYSSRATVPVQCNPDYMNIDNIIKEIKQVYKNTILWNKPGSKQKIRSKLYVDADGYGVISFEGYTLEEDIKNVLSKIREYKNGETV